MAKEGPKKDIDDMTVAELRVRASKLEITGRSAMNKAELRQAVEDAEEQIAALNGGGNGAATKSERPEEKMAAPSIGPHTRFEKRPPGERLAGHEQSDTDAMGLDKRRDVVGGSYGPSLAKQASMYGAFLALLVVLVIGGKIAIDELDKGPDVDEDQAPWAQAEDQRPATDIDFPRNPSP